MPETPNPSQSELQHELPSSTLDTQLRNYLHTFARRTTGLSETTAEAAFNAAQSIVDRNNHIAETFDSVEFREILDDEQKLQGSCALGGAICIDGRIPGIHAGGGKVSLWETKAGLLNTTNSPIDGRSELTAGTLVAAIVDKGQRGQPLLELLIAHTSLFDPSHGCGAMLEKQARGEVPSNVDLVEENLGLHEKSISAIQSHYNRAARSRNQPQLSRVAITSVFDTDTMGLVFGYHNNHSLSTSELTQTLAPVLQNDLSEEFGDIYGEPGVMRKFFTESEFYIGLKRMILNTTGYLLHHDGGIFDEVDTFIASTYPDLTTEQNQALRFLIARTSAFQYLTGLYQFQGVEPHHPFAHHGEGFQALSKDGRHVGNFDPKVQVFGANVSTVQEGIDHVLTQSALMDKGSAHKPFLLFISSAVSANQPRESLQRTTGSNRELTMGIISDPNIQRLIRNNELMPIPVLIDDRTRKILEIPDHNL